MLVRKALGEASGHESKLYWQVEESELRDKCIFLVGENARPDKSAYLTALVSSLTTPDHCATKSYLWMIVTTFG